MKAVHTLLIGMAFPLFFTGCADVKAPTPVPTECYGQGCSNENVVQANLASKDRQINVPILKGSSSDDVIKTNLGGSRD